MRTAVACPPPEQQRIAAALAARSRAVGLRPVLATALAAALVVPMVMGLPGIARQQDGGARQ